MNIFLSILLPLFGIFYSGQDIDYRSGKTFEGIEFQIDESSFNRLKSGLRDKTIAIDDFAIWIERNSNIYTTSEISEQDRAGLMKVYLLNSNRQLLGESEITLMSISDSPSPLSRVSETQLSFLLQSQFDINRFMPDDIYSPHMNYIRSSAETNRLASDIAQRAMRSSNSEHALVLMVIPKQERFPNPVSPASIVFTGTFE